MKKLRKTLTLMGFGALSGASGCFAEFLVLLQQGHRSIQDIAGHALRSRWTTTLSPIPPGPFSVTFPPFVAQGCRNSELRSYISATFPLP